MTTNSARPDLLGNVHIRSLPSPLPDVAIGLAVVQFDGEQEDGLYQGYGSATLADGQEYEVQGGPTAYCPHHLRASLTLGTFMVLALCAGQTMLVTTGISTMTPLPV